MEDTIHTTHSRNPLAMFAPQPEGVTFEGETKGEKIILLLRPHLITLVPAALVTVFLILAPTFVPPFLAIINAKLSQFLNLGQTALLLLIWYLFVFGYAFYKFIFWYFNVYLLTNERIVDFDFRGILHREVSYASLNQIQDVTPKTIGFFSTFFHFGNVFVQTAAAKPEFEFHQVPRPNDVAREILEQMRKKEGKAPDATT